MAAAHSRRAHVRRQGRGGAQLGSAEVGDDKAAQRVDPLGVALGEAVLWAGKSFGRCSGRTTAAHWAGKSSGRWSGPRRSGSLGVAGRRRGALGAAVRSSRSGRRGARDGGGEEDRRRRRLSVGKGGEGKKYMGGPFVTGGATTRDKRPPLLSWVKPPPGTKGPFVPGRGSTGDKRCFWAGRENSQPAAHL